MSTRTERIKRTIKDFTQEQYHELAPPEVKRIRKILEKRGPGLKDTYDRRRARGRQRVEKFIGGMKTKVKGPVKRRVK